MPAVAGIPPTGGKAMIGKRRRGARGPGSMAILALSVALFWRPGPADAGTEDPVAAVKERAATQDYYRSLWDPVHFPPAIDRASDAECLVCHREILERAPRPESPAGLRTAEVLAWYQTLDTYRGPQTTFHQRHATGPLARQLMNLSCNFCHRGNDPREEGLFIPVDVTGKPRFALRKTVNPSETCLRCHGRFPFEVMALEDDWRRIRGDFEDQETKNGCLTCHAELFRTVRHRVTYLKAEAIEEAAKESSDVCYGCHGGRAWYRISYPYPRHPWPGMDEEIPEWAKDRPTRSDPQWRLGGE